MSYNLGTAEGVITTSYNGKGVDAANKDVDKLTKSHLSASQAVDKVGRTSGLAGAAIAAGIGVAVNAAANFEQRMSAVQAVSGASGAEMDQLSKKALQLGKDTSFSATDAASAIEELVKAGISVPDVMNGAADATVALAAAGEVSLPQAATLAANAMNQFNLSAQDMPKVADLIAGAANASAIDVGEFGQSLTQVGAVANLAGANFEDTATAIALMGNAGIKGSDAGTSLKTMLQNLQPGTKKQTELFKALGLITEDGSNQFYDAQGNLKSFAEVAGILQGSLKGMTAAQKSAALETLFGTDAIRAAAIFSNQGAEGFTKMAASMNKVKAADVAKTRLDNFKGSIEQFKGSLETTGIVIGQIFLPILRKVVDFLTSVGNAFLSLPQGVQKAIVIFTAVVGAILLFIAATVKIVKAVQTIIEVAKVLRTVMASTWAATLGPIALIIAAIALLVLGIMYAWKHSETFRNIVLGVWGAIKAAVSAVLTWFTGTLWPGIQAVWNGIVTGLQAIGGFFASVWNGIVAVLTAVWTVITTIVTTGINIMKSIILTAINVILAPWRLFWAVFGDLIKAVFGLIGAIIQLGMAYALKIIVSVGNAIATFWNALWGAIKGFLVGSWNAMSSAVNTAVNKIKGWITSGFNAAKSFITSVWNSVSGFIGQIWNAIWNKIQGPVTAIKNAITSGFNTAKTAASNAFQGMYNAVSQWISNLYKKVSDVVGKVKGIFSGAAGWLIDAGKKIIQGLINGIDAMIGKVTEKINALTSKIKSFLPGSPVKTGPLTVLNHGHAGKEIVKMLVDGIDSNLGMLGPIMDRIPNTFVAKSVSEVTPATGLARAASVANTGASVTPGKTTTINLDVYNPVGKPAAEELSEQATRMSLLGVL